MKNKLFKSFSKLSVGERTAIIAFIGTVLAACIGGIFALLSVYLPTVSNDNQATDNISLNVTNIDFNDWETSSVYGLPLNSDISEINDQDEWDKKREILNTQGYRVLYSSSDFSSIESLLPQKDNIPSATLDTVQMFPTAPLSIELWNINEETPIIIDDIKIELQQYTPVSSGTVDLYFLTGPGIGGG